MTLRVWALLGPILLALVVVVSVSAGTAARTYSDATGDVTGADGPDIASVVVSHNATRVTFTVQFAEAPPLGMSAADEREKWVDMLLVGINVPPIGSAPVWKGVDYYFGVHGNDTGVAQFAKNGVRTFTQLPVVVRGANLTVSVPRAKLGKPTWFGFTVVAGREADLEAQGSADSAPAQGLFRYVLVR